MDNVGDLVVQSPLRNSTSSVCQSLQHRNLYGNIACSKHSTYEQNHISLQLPVTLHDFRLEFHITKHMSEKNSGFGVKHMGLNSEFYNTLTKFRLLSISFFTI